MKNNISIYYGKKDIDLLSWIELIPKGKYPYYIKQALLAKINNKPIFLGKVVINNNLTPIRKNFSITCNEINEFLVKIPTNLRSECIKNILREYIEFTLKIDEEDNFIPSIILNSNNIKIVNNELTKKDNTNDYTNIDNYIENKSTQKVITEITSIETKDNIDDVQSNAYDLLDKMINI